MVTRVIKQSRGATRVTSAVAVDTFVSRFIVLGFAAFFVLGAACIVYANVASSLVDKLYFTFMGVGIFLCLAAIAAFVYYVLRKIIHGFADDLEEVIVAKRQAKAKIKHRK